MTTVLLVEAERRTRLPESPAVTAGPYQVVHAAGAFDGLRKVYEHRPDAVVVSLELEEMAGDEFTRIIRALTDIPIVVVGPGGDPKSIVRVLDAGADDYIEQPVSEMELAGRLRAALRRVQRQRQAQGASTLIRTGELEVDLDEQMVRKGGEMVQLTPTEYRLLAALASRIGKVAPHRFLLSTVWGDEYMDDTHYLRIYVGYLRKKIEDDPADPQYLLSQWGTGYRLANLPVPAAAFSA